MVFFFFLNQKSDCRSQCLCVEWIKRYTGQSFKVSIFITTNIVIPPHHIKGLYLCLCIQASLSVCTLKKKSLRLSLLNDDAWICLFVHFPMQISGQTVKELSCICSAQFRKKAPGNIKFTQASLIFSCYKCGGECASTGQFYYICPTVIVYL